MKEYRHLLGTYKIGERESALKLAEEQFEILVKRGELSKRNMARVEISVYLVDHTPEKISIQDNPEKGVNANEK
jgi:hypothetical protein